MTNFETLVSEFENEVIIEERHMGNVGLYSDGVIWVNENLNSDTKFCVLAEELGHYFTSSGNILDLNFLDSQKQEVKARRWAYEKILPLQAIDSAFGYGCREVWEVAEYLNVDEEFLKEAFEYYKILDIA